MKVMKVIKIRKITDLLQIKILFYKALPVRSNSSL